MIDHLIRSKIKEGGSELDDRSELGKHICKRMPLHNQARLEALYNSWVVYWRVPQQQQAQQQENQRKLKLRIRRRKNRVMRRVDITSAPPPGPNAVGGGVDKVVEEEEEEGVYETRGERMRERAVEVGESLAAAARLGVVVLKGSLWQPLVRMFMVGG